MQTIQKTELKAATDGGLGTGQSEAKQSTGEPKGLKVRAMLRARLGEDIFSSWFHALEFDGFDGKIVYTRFDGPGVVVSRYCEWLESRAA